MSTESSVQPSKTPDIQVLAQPLELPCGMTLPNRLAKAALAEQMADRAHAPTEAFLSLYRRWAQGGSGLVISGNVMVDPRALGEVRDVALEDERHLDVFRRWAQAGTSNGTQLWMQINHPGRQSARYVTHRPVAPSAVSLHMGLLTPLFARPRALSSDEIAALVERFARTAALAQRAGFTGVQLHAAHGYLINQFLSPVTNLRDDEWGGTPEKRRRFLLEVVRATRRAVGPSFPVGVKLNSADFQRGGFSQEESMAVVRMLEAEGIDLLEISGGTFEVNAMLGAGEPVRESTRSREAYFLAYAREVRRQVKTPLMLTGGFRTAAAMAQAVTEGAIDVVGLGRPLCVEPDLPASILAGKSACSEAGRKGVGIASLDGVAELGWYTTQLHRMGQGQPPDRKLSPWLALLKVFAENGPEILKPKRG